MSEETNSKLSNNLSSEERLWATAAHLAAFSGFIFPILMIITPLIIWFLKREQFSFVNEQGKESINFQLTVLLAMIVCIPLVFIGIGIFLLFALAAFDFVFVVIASIQANQGIHYKYPIALRLIK